MCFRTMINLALEVLLFGERDRSNLLRDTDSAKSHANVFPTSNQGMLRLM